VNLLEVILLTCIERVNVGGVELEATGGWTVASQLVVVRSRLLTRLQSVSSVRSAFTMLSRPASRFALVALLAILLSSSRKYTFGFSSFVSAPEIM